MLKFTQSLLRSWSETQKSKNRKRKKGKITELRQAVLETGEEAEATSKPLYREEGQQKPKWGIGMKVVYSHKTQHTWPGWSRELRQVRPGQYLDGRIKISSISQLLLLRNSGEETCAGLCWKFVSRELPTSRERDAHSGRWTELTSKEFSTKVIKTGTRKRIRHTDTQTHKHTDLSSSTEPGLGRGHLCFYNGYSLEIRFN